MAPTDFHYISKPCRSPEGTFAKLDKLPNPEAKAFTVELIDQALNVWTLEHLRNN